MRILRAQCDMSDTIDGNLEALVVALQTAKQASADLVLTPELALTGFHAGIARLAEANALRDALDEVSSVSERLEVPIVVGAPVPGGNERQQWANGTYFVDSRGDRRLLQSKVGLTASEAQFFAAGDQTRPLELLGQTSAVVFCREMLDQERLAALTDVQIVLWPSYISWTAGTDSKADYERAAARLAGALDCWIIQCNWANAINDPEQRGMGRSVVVNPDGDIIDEASSDRPELSVIQVPH